MPPRIATWAELMSPLSQGANDYDVRHDAVAANGGIGTKYIQEIRGGLFFIPFSAPTDERTHNDQVWRAETQIRATYPEESLYWCCLRVGRKFTNPTEQEAARMIRQSLCDGELAIEVKFDSSRATLSGPVYFKIPRRSYNCVGWCSLE